MSKRLPYVKPDECCCNCHQKDSYSFLQFESMVVSLMVVIVIAMLYGNRFRNCWNNSISWQTFLYLWHIFPNRLNRTSL